MYKGTAACLALVSHWKKAVWYRNGLLRLQFTTYHQGKLRQELKFNHQGITAYWLAFHSSLNMHLRESRAPCAEMAPPTEGWALPHQSLVTKMPASLAIGKSGGGSPLVEGPPS